MADRPRAIRIVPAATRLLADARWRLRLLLALGALQGLFYVALMPPWQHYDEPSHFEYAWLLANGGSAPGAALIRREIVASMAAHGFYPPGGAPDLLLATAPSIGYSQLDDPPLYYLGASLPLRLLRHQDLAVQLYAARLVSLACFLATLAVAAGLMGDLVGRDHPLRWAVPLLLAALPPFIDLMTAVNNDVGAVLACSLFWWGGVRVLRRGLNGRRLAWLLAAALAAALTKNTALLAPALLPGLLIYVWGRERRWWRPLVRQALAVGLAAALALFALWGLRWHDAAFWYRTESINDAPARAAVDGGYALSLAVESRAPTVLAQPLPPAAVERLGGKQITVGGWFWADQPALIDGVGLALGDNPLRVVLPGYQPFTVTAAPAWHSWATVVPTTTGQIQLFLSGRTPPAQSQAAGANRLLVRAPFLVEGALADAPPPALGVADRWAGQANLLRNAAADDRWPQFNPILNRLIARLMPGTPQQLLSSLLDLGRSGPLLWRMLARQIPADFFLVLAWGGLRIGGADWAAVARLAWLVALAGCVRWLLDRRPAEEIGARPRGLRAGLALLGLAAVLAVAITVIRALPLLQTAAYTSVRYAYPAIIPLALALVGGWRSIAPRRYRAAGLAVLAAGLALLNLAALAAVLAFHRSFV